MLFSDILVQFACRFQSITRFRKQPHEFCEIQRVQLRLNCIRQPRSVISAPRLGAETQPDMGRNWSKELLSLLGGVAVIYCVATEVFVVTNPDLRLRALLTDTNELSPGVILQAVPSSEDCPGAYTPPEPGDLLIEIHERPIRNFAEFARSLVQLRTARIDPGGKLFPGSDPAELSSGSTHALVEIDSKRYTRIRFFRQSELGDGFETEASICWVRLQSMPTTGLMLTLIWLVPQLLIFSVGAMAYWNRPSDPTARLFFLLNILTLFAFVGGSHWWVVAGSLWLTVPFAVSAVILPAVLLHLFLLFPTPKALVVQRPFASTLTIYALPWALASLLTAEIVAAAWLSDGVVEGPFSRIWSGHKGAIADGLLLAARMTISFSVLAAGGYFLVTMGVLVERFRQARSPLERQQMGWILIAGLLAACALGYALNLAFFDRVALASGKAQIPMFLASVCFMLAFAVGMLRPNMSALGDVISRGMQYYAVSAGLAALYALLIAGGIVLALKNEVSLLDEAIAVTLVIMLTIAVLSWWRDRLQRLIDRKFFREKYQLDKALDRMNQAVAGLWDRATLAEQMLNSCCDVLGVSRAACYFRESPESEFQRLSVRGTPVFPEQIPASPSLLNALRQGQSLQRVRAGGSPSQELLRSVGAELIHGLAVDGEAVGLIVLGRKPNAAAFTSEDVTFLTAFERVAGFAMHFAKVHDDFGRLNNELQLKVDRIAEQQRQIAHLERQLSLQSRVDDQPTGDAFQAREIIGSSPAIRQVLETVRKVANSESSVLIRGESGTGKELLARAIHHNSPRREGPMVSLHCAALSPTLLESELFGHVRGAFTDAREDKIGRFQLADGGTLFLDEIGDISADVQVKLLRVLQQQTFEPVGSHRTVQVNVRVVTATHRNLEELIGAGRFREDLYYRLNVISVTLPPLRERMEDLLDLAMDFLARANKRAGKAITQIDEAAHRQLMQHTWPGNVRELQNVIERAVVLAEGNRITPADLPQDVLLQSRLPRQVIEAKPHAAVANTGTDGLWAPGRVSRRTSGTAEEREQLIQALERASGNKARAARLLGLPRSTFCSKLDKHSLS